MTYSICTSNQEFIEAEIHLDGFHSSSIPITYDELIQDHQWQLCRDGEWVGRPHDITPTVGADIRRAVTKDQEHPAPTRARPAAPEAKPVSYVEPPAPVDVTPAESAPVEPVQAPPEPAEVPAPPGYHQPMFALFSV